jgi:cytidine deaminase
MVDLPESLGDLFDAAAAARAHAYAPYSDYAVGAAVRTDDGRIFAGCNVENAAYPQGWCAETSALGAMVTAGARTVVEVLTICAGEPLGTCCGGCRQKLREFARLDVLVHACTPTGLGRTFTLGELLPASFGPEHIDAAPRSITDRSRHA